MATGCGYSYPVIDDMTMAQAEEIFGHWEHTPPTYQAVGIIAQMLGWKPKGTADEAAAESTADQLLAAMPPGMSVSKGVPVMPAPLSIEELREQNRKRMAGINAGRGDETG